MSQLTSQSFIIKFHLGLSLKHTSTDTENIFVKTHDQISLIIFVTLDFSE